jgi:creatinine amidohydrolase
MLYDYQSTSFDVRDGRPDVAILPIGAMEQEGDHLPVGAVTLVLEEVARLVAEALPESAYLLPVLPFGASASHLGAAGTVSLSWSTMMDVVTDIVEALLAQGFRRVVVISGLGGPNEFMTRPRENYIVKTAVRQLNYAHPEADILWVQPFTAARVDLQRILEAPAEDMHAGELTTSLLLHLAPALVEGTGQDFVPQAERSFLDYVPFAELSPSGVWGRPSLASADKGRRSIDAAVRATVEYVGKSFKYLAENKKR